MLTGRRGRLRRLRAWETASRTWTWTAAAAAEREVAAAPAGRAARVHRGDGLRPGRAGARGAAVGHRPVRLRVRERLGAGRGVRPVRGGPARLDGRPAAGAPGARRAGGGGGR